MSGAAKKQLGLIGFGQFGRFAAAHLAPHFELLVSDCQQPDSENLPEGARAVDPLRAAACPIVVLAVPVQALRDVIETISEALQPGTLVIDVCSVKLAPLRWMRDLLPEHVEILGTHPLFGPQSAADGLDGHMVVVCPERTTRAAATIAFLESLGLRVVVADAETHDRQIAHTQALAQYLGRALAEIEGLGEPIGTPAARQLREMAGTVANDSWELFVAIQHLNPHAAEMRSRLREVFARVDARLDAAAAQETSC